MKVFKIILASTAVLTAALAVDTRHVEVTVQLDKTTMERELQVLDPSTGRILGHSCTNTLSSGNFAQLPILADLDENGDGHLVVGATKYLVHENPEYSGGISCGTMHSDMDMFMSCLVPVSSFLEPEALDANQIRSCFSHADGLGLKMAAESFMLGTGQTKHTEHTENTTAAILEARNEDVACSPTSDYTIRANNPDPYQWYLHKQLTDTMQCRTSSCSPSHGGSQSFSFGWSSSVSPYEWISGGFDVSKSWDTSNSYGCTGQPHTSVCVWSNVAHTKYSVENVAANPCTRPQVSKPFRMMSPNKDNIGGYKYCGHGKFCQHIDAQYWVQGRAGKP